MKDRHEYFVVTKGFGREVREWVEAESMSAAHAKAAERHGVSIKVENAKRVVRA